MKIPKNETYTKCKLKVCVQQLPPMGMGRIHKIPEVNSTLHPAKQKCRGFWKVPPKFYSKELVEEETLTNLTVVRSLGPLELFASNTESSRDTTFGSSHGGVGFSLRQLLL